MVQDGQRLKHLPLILLRPLPLGMLQPVLGHIARGIAARHPRIGQRLGAHAGRVFVIDPLNLPFVLLLVPDPAAPLLRACRRGAEPADAVARIAGSFLDLLRLIDARNDGDALFFSRALRVTGDTEAVVRLRNALDDIDGSIAADVAALLGPPGRFAHRCFARFAA